MAASRPLLNLERGQICHLLSELSTWCEFWIGSVHQEWGTLEIPWGKVGTSCIGKNACEIICMVPGMLQDHMQLAFPVGQLSSTLGDLSIGFPVGDVGFLSKSGRHVNSVSFQRTRIQLFMGLEAECKELYALCSDPEWMITLYFIILVITITTWP